MAEFSISIVCNDRQSIKNKNKNESFSMIDGQKTAELTLEALKQMRTDESAKLFFDTTVKKSIKI